MSSPTSGAEFRLDVEKAQAAVADLRRVHDQLVELRNQAVDVARPAGTARDAVSIEAHDLLSLKAAGGPGSLSDAVSGAITHVEDLIVRMEADMSRQVELDASAARDLARS